MKVAYFICSFLVLALEKQTADALRNRFQFSPFRTFARQEDATTNGNDGGYSYEPPPESTDAPESGPYPPSGWRPNGELLLLPGETHSSQVDSTYGGPSNGNGAPSNGYGAPSNGNGVPSNGNGAPSNGYGAPSNGNGAPSNGKPSNNYGAPNQPSNGYIPPNGQNPNTESTPPDSQDQNPASQNPDEENEPVEGPQNGNQPQNGQYYVLLPDGKLQRVQYSGKQQKRGKYVAQVQYEIVEPVRSPVYTYQGVSFN